MIIVEFHLYRMKALSVLVVVSQGNDLVSFVVYLPPPFVVALNVLAASKLQSTQGLQIKVN